MQHNEQPSFFSLLYTLGEQIRNIKMVITLQENSEKLCANFHDLQRIAIHPGLDIPSYTAPRHETLLPHRD